MSSTKRDRRSYSLFKGNDGRSTLCDMVARLEEQLEESKGREARAGKLIERMLLLHSMEEQLPKGWQGAAKEAEELGIRLRGTKKGEE